jgi:uncharacterized membrane protein
MRSSLWVVPAISTLAAFLSTHLLRSVDKTLSFKFFHFSPDGARALAGIESSAMISFVVLFFSVLLLTVQIASSTLTPRIIVRPFRSRTLKASLALFAFTLVYSMALVARGPEGEIGQLSATIVIILTMSSICVFLYVVEYVSKQLRPVTVIADVASEALDVIKTVYPEVIGQQDVQVEQREAENMLRMPARVILYEGTPGVLLAFDIETLLDVAIRAACAIEVVPEVGDFVANGDPVFRLYFADAAVISNNLLQHIELGRERTLEQDPAFAFRIIVDIASKGLSPAINDPTTAVLALDQIHYLLREVGLRRLDAGLVHDASGQLRLIYHTPNWEDFVELAVTEIRQFGANSTQVTRRMRSMLEDLIRKVPPNRSSILQQELELLESTVGRSFAVLIDRNRAGSPDVQGLGGRRKAV